MPNTATAELPYPLSSSTVNVPSDIQALAVAADLAFQIQSNEDTFLAIGTASVSTTSASYVDVTSASKSFTKVGSAAQSDLLIQLSAGGFSTVGATAMKLGVRVNGVDRDITMMLFNSANSHGAFPTGNLRITGLAAGAYTIQVRALRQSGTGVCTIDSNDAVSMFIAERLI